MSLWDFAGGFGEALADMGGTQSGGGMFGLGSLFNDSASYGDTFKGLDYVGFPGGGGGGSQSFPTTIFHQTERSVPNMSEGWYQSFMNQYNEPGSVFNNYTQPFMKAYQARMQDPMDIALRNAEHGLYSNYMWDVAGAAPGAFMSGFTVPAYTGLKWGAQNIPGGSFINNFLPKQWNLNSATPASWDEVWWGLRPFWGKN